MPGKAKIKADCKKCKYRSKLSSYIICDYIGVMKHSRGCKADEFCIRFEQGAMINKKSKQPMVITN